MSPSDQDRWREEEEEREMFQADKWGNAPELEHRSAPSCLFLYPLTSAWSVSLCLVLFFYLLPTLHGLLPAFKNYHQGLIGSICRGTSRESSVEQLWAQGDAQLSPPCHLSFCICGPSCLNCVGRPVTLKTRDSPRPPGVLYAAGAQCVRVRIWNLPLPLTKYIYVTLGKVLISLNFIFSFEK